MKHNLVSFLFALGLVGACGSDGESVKFSDVTAIALGDAVGTSLTGTYSGKIEITSDNCRNVDAIGAPKAGDVSAPDVIVDQKDGAISFNSIHLVVRGGMFFDNHFEVGGGLVIDVGGAQDNFLQTERYRGRFLNADQFEGNGLVHYEGTFEDKNYDCTYSFRATGIRKP